MSESEPIGSVSEEAFKLFRALNSSGEASKTDEPHVCTATWCPVCQVVRIVRDNPDAVAQASASAAAFARSLRDLLDPAAGPKDEDA